MLCSNNKKVAVIGFQQSAATQDMFLQISEENSDTFIISPNQLFKSGSNFLQSTSFINSVTLDKNLRVEINDLLKQENADRCRFIHSSCLTEFDCTDANKIKQLIGQGTYIGGCCSISGSICIGENCLIEMACILPHHIKIGNNTILHGGTNIGGKCEIGNNCELNMKSIVLASKKICDNVIIGAVSNVTKNITEPGFYAGYRARKTVSSNQINEQL